MSLLPFDLTEFITAEMHLDDRLPDELLHASSHMTGSLRHAQLDVAGAPKLPETLIDRVPAFTGTLWHERLETWIRGQNMWIMSEVDVTPFLPKGWGGRVDHLVYNPMEKAFVLVDLKTTNGDSLRWIRKDGAKLEHVHQASAYWHAVRRAGLPLMKEIVIYYFPVSKPRERGDVAEPVECEIVPLPWKDIHAEMRTRQEAVRAYLDSLPFGHEDGSLALEDYLTPALAPVQERVQKLTYKKTAGTWELLLVPHWSAQFCRRPEELCDCSAQGQTKIGQYERDIAGAWTYFPRDGFDEIAPELAPR